jgi:hypothetical protein
MSYHYRISAANQPEMNFTVHLDKSRHQEKTQDSPIAPPARWTQLAYCQCANCTLPKKEHEYCPLALNIEPLVDELANIHSTTEFSVVVTSDGRHTHFKATAQDVLCSLIGLVTATSGCPHTLFLNPMARFHQPLASIEETFYRVASMYQLAQYYRRRNGLDYDEDFDGLIDYYEEIRKVNKGIKHRLNTAVREDATMNAICILDALAMMISASLEDELKSFDRIFDAYLQDSPIQ